MNKISNPGDLRVRRTRKLLWEALMSLIAERDFETLTVNDICDRALIHRTTFYNHYQDKYDLLDSGMAAMYEALTSAFEPPEKVITAYAPDQPPPYFVSLFQHVLDHKPFYTAMFNGGIVNPFREQIHAYIVAQSQARLTALHAQRGQSAPVPQALIAHFNAGAIISALVWWVRTDFAITPDEMASHLMRLIAYGNFSLFKE
ncbi:MAG: TetR/AcrR family transcriptional regulator [Chloroflexi bacterium]|nr:TetR/AcrR family transcriptional regulator [Chloroflexota bacterium]